MTTDPQQSGRGPGLAPMALAGLGLELVAPVIAGAWLGYKLDGWLDSAPWLFVGGFLLGLLVSGWSFFRRFWPPRGGGGESS